MPASLDRVRRASCSRAAASSRAAAAAGSALTIRPASRVSNRPQGSDPSTNPAIAASTTPAAATDRCRVLAATSRAFDTRASRATTRAQINGNRSRTSRASATSRRADHGLICIRAPSSANANSATDGVPTPPTRTARSSPGNTRPAPASESPECWSANTAASTNNPASTSVRTACRRDTSSSVASTLSGTDRVTCMEETLPASTDTNRPECRLRHRMWRTIFQEFSTRGPMLAAWNGPARTKSARQPPGRPGGSPVVSREAPATDRRPKSAGQKSAEASPWRPLSTRGSSLPTAANRPSRCCRARSRSSPEVRRTRSTNRVNESST